MNEHLVSEMEILWSNTSEYSLDLKLEAFDRFKSKLTKEDLPELVILMSSDKNDFWIRELLAEPIADLGGTMYLFELFEAQHRNELEGHDNDLLNHYLTEIAELEPIECKRKLKQYINDSNFQYRDSANWLLEFCE